jgi:hypothetical protein
MAGFLPVISRLTQLDAADGETSHPNIGRINVATFPAQARLTQ